MLHKPYRSHRIKVNSNPAIFPPHPQVQLNERPESYIYEIVTAPQLQNNTENQVLLQSLIVYISHKIVVMGSAFVFRA